MSDGFPRRREREWMDEPHADADQLRRSLRFIRRVNRFLGYTRVTINHLERFSHRWPPGKPIRILDIATGSADIPLVILGWAKRRGHDVKVVGLDLHSATIQHAQAAAANEPRLCIVRGDARRLPFANASFDYCMANMFLHHLDEAEVIAVLAEMDRVASRGLIVSDLLRDARAHRWIKLLTLLSNPMAKHDAAASVAQAFTGDEIRSLAQRAGLSYAHLDLHFGRRFALTGEKGLTREA